MKTKKMAIFILAALMLFSLAACSENTKDPAKETDTKHATEPKIVEVTPSEVEAAVAKALGDEYLCTVDIPEEEMMMSMMADIDMSKVSSYVGKQALVTALNMDTVIVLNCKDGYAEEAVKILNENYSRTVDYIRQYPFGVAKVEGARLYRTGETVMFILAGASYDGDDAEKAAELAAAEYRKIDGAIKALIGTLPENLASVSKS